MSSTTRMVSVCVRSTPLRVVLWLIPQSSTSSVRAIVGITPTTLRVSASTRSAFLLRARCSLPRATPLPQGSVTPGYTPGRRMVSVSPPVQLLQDSGRQTSIVSPTISSMRLWAIFLYARTRVHNIILSCFIVALSTLLGQRVLPL